ncbi:MAG: sulfur carrier protein ThiS [Mariniblastus sp.]|nr:sulfur carrier protein ThiS [Mariniblastus sp.]
MEIIVNGDPHQIPQGTSIADLLMQFKLNPCALAIEVNQELKPRNVHRATFLSDGDVLEIVTLVGGG